MIVLLILKKSAVIMCHICLSASSQLMISISPFIHFLLHPNLHNGQETQTPLFYIQNTIKGKKKTCLTEKANYLLSVIATVKIIIHTGLSIPFSLTLLQNHVASGFTMYFSCTSGRWCLHFFFNFFNC